MQAGIRQHCVHLPLLEIRLHFLDYTSKPPAMSRSAIAVLALLAASTTAHAEIACETGLPSPPSGAQVPLAQGFVAITAGALPAYAHQRPADIDLAYSVDRVLQRRQWDTCREAIALALTPVAAPLPMHDDYIKQTEFDNTPYRFNMTQNGKRMTADDFDALLQANGYSVGRRIGPEVVTHRAMAVYRQALTALNMQPKGRRLLLIS